MKKKKIIISICLVLVLLLSAFVTVYATNGDENNIFEQLKELITGNTNRIEELEKDVDTLEKEIADLKGQVTELQNPKEEEKETQTENKDTNDNKTTTNTTSKKATANTTAKKTSTATTSNNQSKIDALNKEIATVKKDIEELEKQDNKQTKDIENLKNELDNKSEELKNLINSSSSSNSSKIISKSELVGTWDFAEGIRAVFKDDGTVIWGNTTYKYTINEDWIYLDYNNTGKRQWSFKYEYKDGKFCILGQGGVATKTSNNTTTLDKKVYEAERLTQISKLREKGALAQSEATIKEQEYKYSQKGSKEEIIKVCQDAISYYKQAIAKYIEIESVVNKDYSNKKIELETKIQELQNKINNWKK